MPEDPRNEPRVQAAHDATFAPRSRDALPEPPPGARTTTRGFIAYTWPEFEWNWHHVVWCRWADRWIAGEVRNLMVFAPRRHSKTEVWSVRLPALVMGMFPDDPVMWASHTARMSRKISRAVQRVICSPRYRKLFPGTRLPGGSVQRERDEVRGVRTMLEWELEGHKGVYQGMPVGQGAAGYGFKWGGCDDVYKSREDAMSPTKRENVRDWWAGDFVTSAHPDARKLMVNTRYAVDDLPGTEIRAARDNPDADQWTVLSMAALKEAA